MDVKVRRKWSIKSKIKISIDLITMAAERSGNEGDRKKAVIGRLKTYIGRRSMSERLKTEIGNLGMSSFGNDLVRCPREKNRKWCHNSQLTKQEVLMLKMGCCIR
nr:hypothetical protein [Tanacetum cinerariifolium]